MNSGNIVIVGNGFDVNHGLPSSYANFKIWLCTNDKVLFDFLERYIDVDGNWWNDFERSLSEIDVPKLINETPLENRPYMEFLYKSVFLSKFAIGLKIIERHGRR